MDNYKIIPQDDMGIKPCPNILCQSNLCLIENYLNGSFCAIRCVECGCTTEMFSTLKDAIKFWNNRLSVKESKRLKRLRLLYADCMFRDIGTEAMEIVEEFGELL